MADRSAAKNPGKPNWARGTRLSALPVYDDEAEGHGAALLPLKVVHQAPVEISLNRKSVGDAALDAFQCSFNKRQSAGIIGGGNAVFRYIQGLLEILRRPAQNMLQWTASTT